MSHTNDLVIREATLQDIDKILELESLCPEQGYLTLIPVRPRELLEQQLTSGEDPTLPFVKCYVATDSSGEHVYGLSNCKIMHVQIGGRVLRGMYLFGSRVSPAYRRKGIAKRLWQYANQQASERFGCEVNWMICEVGNQNSIACYRNIGYRIERSYHVHTLWVRRRRGVDHIQVRKARQQDADLIAREIEKSYGSHHFFTPRDICSFQDSAKTLFRFQIDDFHLLLDQKNEVVAGAHVSPLPIKMTVQNAPMVLKALNFLLRGSLLGQPLRFFTASDIFFSKDLSPVEIKCFLKYLVRSHYESADFMIFTCDPADKIYPLLHSVGGYVSNYYLMIQGDAHLDPLLPCYFPRRL